MISSCGPGTGQAPNDSGDCLLADHALLLLTYQCGPNAAVLCGVHAGS